MLTNTEILFHVVLVFRISFLKKYSNLIFIEYLLCAKLGLQWSLPSQSS